jgi:hypothetical protein
MADRVNPTFKILEDKDVTAGVHRLNPDLTINGTTVYPMLRYKGGDANGTNWPAWGYGETLTLQAGTAPSYNQGSPLTGPQDDSVKFNEGGYYKASNNSFADITTEDVVVEMVIKLNTSKLIVEFGKLDTESYFCLLRTGANLLLCRFFSDSSAVDVDSTSPILDSWYHCMCFLDRNGSGVWYLNGTNQSSPVDISSKSSTITNTGSFTLGAIDTGYTSVSSYAYLSIWKYDNWLDTHLQAAIAKERFAKLTGVYPISANGTTKTPTIMTRDTSAYLEKYVYGPELISDGNMEAADTSAWSAHNGATITKETSSPHGGIRNIKAAYSGSNYPGVKQDVLTIGKTYRIAGRFRTDGTCTAYVLATPGIASTTSTNWDSFDFTFVSAADPIVYLYSSLTSAGYVEFDDVSVKEILPTELYKVGPNWPRFCGKIDKNNDQFFGYLAEKQSINLLLQSEDFTTTWAKADAGDTIAKDVALAPNNTLTANVMTSSTTDGNHYVVQNGLNLPHGIHTFSTFAKKGDVDFAMLYDGVIGHYAFFNLSTGQVGTVAAGAAAYMENYGDGWYRCVMRFPASESSYGLSIFSAASDNDLTYEGNGASASLYIWGAQLETGSIITSYIPTTTLAVTRGIDRLRYKGDDGNILNNKSGSLEFKTLISGSINDGYSGGMITITDGADINDRILVYSPSYTYHVHAYVLSSGEDSGFIDGSPGDVSVYNNEIHKYRLLYKKNLMECFLDGTPLGTSDTGVGVPDDLDEIEVAAGQGGIIPLTSGLISNIKIFSKPTKKG